MFKKPSVFKKVTTKQTTTYYIPKELSVREKIVEEQWKVERALEQKKNPPSIKLKNKTTYRKASEEEKENRRNQQWEREFENFIQHVYEEEPDKITNFLKFRIKRELGGSKDFKFIVSFIEVLRPEPGDSSDVKKEREKAKNQIILYTQNNDEELEKRILILPKDWKSDQLAVLIQLNAEVIEESITTSESEELISKINSGEICWQTY